MHDIKLIRENIYKFVELFKKRNMPDFTDQVLAFDDLKRKNVTSLQELSSKRNESSKKAGEAKAKGDEEEFERWRDSTTRTKDLIAKVEENSKYIETKLRDLLLMLPNYPMDDVTMGLYDANNVELSKTGEPPKFDFNALEHFEIPAVSNGMDFKTAGKISGSRFVILSGAVARIHRALAQFMLDLHINEHELLEINTPVIVNSETLQGTGQLPKFANDCYKLNNDNADAENAIDHWLIPTSEVPLTNIVAGEILHKDQLPLRYCAHSLCFRKEAGSAGRDTAGMLRQHQFEKVEMVSITHPSESRKELDLMTERAENVLKKLGLPFRTMELCTGDLGFSAQRTHDIEVWLPGQGCYREISSVSVCGDFQARRMNARFREKDGDKPQFVHTLNGSGVAVGRCLIAVLENGQQKDGSVKLPKALHPYLGGKDTINPDGILEKAT